MSIVKELESSLNLKHETVIKMETELYNFNTLAPALAQCKRPQEVVNYMYVELITRKRDSVIARIYMRYRKLAISRDLEALKAWANQKK